MAAALDVASEAHTTKHASAVATTTPHFWRDRLHRVPIDSGPLRQSHPVRAASVAWPAASRGAGEGNMGEGLVECGGARSYRYEKLATQHGCA